LSYYSNIELVYNSNTELVYYSITEWVAEHTVGPVSGFARIWKQALPIVNIMREGGSVSVTLAMTTGCWTCRHIYTHGDKQ